MAQYGLGNFLYDLTVEDGGAKFKFFDPQDPDNTAEVSVNKNEFPDGIVDADSRQVADLAYAKCSKLLNDKRDNHRRIEAANDLSKRNAQEAKTREAAADFLNNSQDLAARPNAGEDNKPSQHRNDDKKK